MKAHYLHSFLIFKCCGRASARNCNTPCPSSTSASFCCSKQVPVTWQGHFSKPSSALPHREEGGTNLKLPQETQLPTLQTHCSQLVPAPQPRQAPNFAPNPSIRLKKPGFTPVQMLGSGARPKLLPAVQLMPVALLSRAQPVWE